MTAVVSLLLSLCLSFIGSLNDEQKAGERIVWQVQSKQ